MDTGRPGGRRLRFDFGEPFAPPEPKFDPVNFDAGSIESGFERAVDEPLMTAIERTRAYLLGEQHSDGYWVGELEGDTILESEYILLLAYLGRENSDVAKKAANYLLKQQLPNGGWSSYPGGPLEISGSVKAYFALKVTGHSPDADYMVRARQAIHAAGGAESINSFTRYYLALLGALSYRQCPAVPPEIMLVPKWAPFNIYEMSAWSRTIVVPLVDLVGVQAGPQAAGRAGHSRTLPRPAGRLARDDAEVGAARQPEPPDADRLARLLPPRRSGVEIRRSFSTLSLSSTGRSPGRALDVRTVRQ